MMPKTKKFPYRRSINFSKEQGEYLDILVKLKYFDSHAQAIRFFVEFYQTHRDSNTILPTMAELKKGA